MLGSSGGQASSSAGAFEGPSTVLQPPTVVPPVVSQHHVPPPLLMTGHLQERRLDASVKRSNSDGESADPPGSPRITRGMQSGMMQERDARCSEFWTGGSGANLQGGLKSSHSIIRPPSLFHGSSAEWRTPSPEKEPRVDYYDEHLQRSTQLLMTAPPSFGMELGTHSARLSHGVSAAYSPRQSRQSPRPSFRPSQNDIRRDQSVMSMPADGFWGGQSLTLNFLGNRPPLSAMEFKHIPPNRDSSMASSCDSAMDRQASVLSADPTTSRSGPSTYQELRLNLPGNAVSGNVPRFAEEGSPRSSGPKASRISDSGWVSHYTGNGTQSFGIATDNESYSSRVPRPSAFVECCATAARWVAASSITPKRVIWEIIWLLCVLHELWAVPLELIFMPKSESTDLSTLKWVVLACFLADMCLNFFAGYVEKEHFVVDNKKIVYHYLHTWFLMDFCLIVDLVLLVYSSKSKVLKFLKLLRVARLCRTWNNVQFILRLCGHQLCCRLLVHAGHLNLALLLLAHVHAVAWAALQPGTWMALNSEEAYDRYLESLWWAFSAVTFGCEAPVSTQGQWLLGILIAAERETLLAGVIFCLVRCVLIHGSTDLDEDPIQDEVLGFLKCRKIPATAQQEVLANVRQVCKARKLQNCYDALSGQALPMQIRTSVAEMLWRPKLCSLGLVKELINYHSEFATELTLTIHGEFLPSLTVLYENNEASHIAYYVINGALEVTYADDLEQPTDDYIAGMWAGEKAVVNFELRRGETVTCKTLAELMVLSAMEFRRLLTRFELVGIFEDLIKVNLWLGFCGRCGLFGDHFSRDCPSLELLRKNQGFFRSLLPRRDSALKMAPRNPIGKDLRVFLQDYSLEHLLSPMCNHGIMSLMDLTREKIDELAQDPDVGLTPEEEEILNHKIKSFRKKHAAGATKILANTGTNDNYLVFISHYKVEAGTEATLMQNDILQLIAEDPGLPGHDLSSPVFLDTEDLRDLGLLKEHVKRSHNLLLLLTNGVLKRPWVLLELVTAVKNDVTVLPVEIQRPDLKFTYPDDDYYKRLLNGQELDDSATQLLKEEGVELEDLCSSLRQVFKRIALPFSPHKTATIRKAELQDILKRCRIKRGRASFSTEQSTMMQVCRQTTYAADGSAWGPSTAGMGDLAVGRVMTTGHQTKGRNWSGGVKKVAALTKWMKRTSHAGPQFSDALSGSSASFGKQLSEASASARRMKKDRAERGVRRIHSDTDYASKAIQPVEKSMQPILSESIVGTKTSEGDVRLPAEDLGVTAEDQGPVMSRCSTSSEFAVTGQSSMGLLVGRLASCTEYEEKEATQATPPAGAQQEQPPSGFRGASGSGVAEPSTKDGAHAAEAHDA